jgi:CRP-like cAMP-binding protein
MIESKTLQHYSLFGGLLEDQINQILPYMEYKTLEAGELLMTEGERNEKIYFILQGRVDIVKNGNVLLHLDEGDTLGEMEVLDVQPSAATGLVTEKSTIASISNKALRQIYKQDAEIFSLMVMNLARDLSRRLRRMDEWHCWTPMMDGAIPESPSPKRAK